MPPLALHTAIAKDIADRLNLATLDDERGSLYLGSTAPDIRVAMMAGMKSITPFGNTTPR